MKPTGAAGLRLRADEFMEFFAKQLTPHFRAEEEILFPLMRAEVPESAPLIEALLRDHESFRRRTPNLQSNSGLSKLIFDLGDLLERHIRREERELFPLFEQRVETGKAAAAGEQIKAVLTAEAGTEKS
jgi:iron-sulfur cluster repair protein YtfE (RIC family)